MEIALNEVPLFIRSGRCIPLADAAEYVEEINTEHLKLIGFKSAEYVFYDDDGIHKDFDMKKNCRVIKY